MFWCSRAEGRHPSIVALALRPGLTSRLYLPSLQDTGLSTKHFTAYNFSVYPRRSACVPGCSGHERCSWHLSVCPGIVLWFFQTFYRRNELAEILLPEVAPKYLDKQVQDSRLLGLVHGTAAAWLAVIPSPSPSPSLSKVIMARGTRLAMSSAAHVAEQCCSYEFTLFVLEPYGPTSFQFAQDSMTSFVL